jgi:imidazolonepropionase-like amidohydrolase
VSFISDILGALPLARSLQPRPLLVRDVTVLDPRDGSRLDHHDISVADKRIDAIAPTGELPSHGRRIIDGAGTVALPGLIDCHAHVCGVYQLGPPEPADAAWIPGQIAKNLRAMLRSGVTTVRDMAGPLHVALALRGLAARGMITAPRLLIPGPLLTCSGGYPTYIPPLPLPARALMGRLRIDVDTPDQARAWVKRLAARRVDLIKVAYTSAEYDDERTAIPLLRADVLRAITAAAHQHGLPVAVHHIWAEDLPSLLELPFDNLEHLSIEREITDADVDRIVARDLPVTTTLMTYGIIDYAAALSRLAHDGQELFAPKPARQVAQLIDEIRNGSFRIPFIGRQVIETGMTHMLPNLRRLRDAGVLIGAGTDAGGAITPCGQILWELRAMERAGYSPLEAVRAATSDAARVIGRPELGVLEAGRPADLVLCRGNPAESLAALEQIELVVRDGLIMHDPDRRVEASRHRG